MIISHEEIKKFIKREIKGVIHVGAHKAEELEYYSNKLNVENVIWIEANLDLISDISNRISKKRGHSVVWAAAYDEDFLELNLNISNKNYGESSSLLDLKKHSEVYPDVFYLDKKPVITKRIDSIIEYSAYDISRYNFINLDTQGTELKVLKGCEKILENIDYIYCETNEIEMYKGCCLSNEIDEYLKKYSFIKKINKNTNFGWGESFYVKENCYKYL
jgi:FkbM family methyltransferase